MSAIEARYQEELDQAPASPGLRRFLAFDADGFRVVRSIGDPGTVSGWHHHGDYDVYGFMVSGKARFEKDGEDENAIDVGPGDFFHVPPHTVHREINPSTEEGQEIILFLKGSGPLVTNVKNHGGG
ncbi:MAG: cupin domain-containing protein [Anaerolineales bacterium]|jgi:quercetin dioxygenase-like cupin family protein